jgi:glutamine synthetase
LPQSPRLILNNLIAEAKGKNFLMKTGVEAEFFLLDETGRNVSDQYDYAVKPCYDQMCLMRRYDVISEICDYLFELGWEPYQNDHEDANGQFEINWKYDDCLKTADKHTFFKFLVKSVAEKHGFKASFMPKPFKDLTGNGCHMHVSCWDKESTYCMFDVSQVQRALSDFGEKFLSGVIKHAHSFSAITNPTVNSYRRINSSSTKSGSTWAPTSVSWTSNNRTHMVRIPEKGRFELRLADGAVNPYLLQSVVLASGILGLEGNYELPNQLFTNNFEEKNQTGNKLPLNLGDALQKLSIDNEFINKVGKEFIFAYLKLKKQEWNNYLSQFSEWEIKNTLDI